MTRYLALSASCLVALGACAGRTPPPAISYDSAQFRPAAMSEAPEPKVRVIEVPTPLPLPGQLLSLSSTRAPAEAGPPSARVEAANRAALREPSRHGYVNAVQVYPWAEGAIYQLYTAPERVSDIALQPGETLTAVAAGDTVRWVVGDTSSGSGPAKRTHILVKPIAPGLKTNLVITTDRRSYHLQLESTSATAMAAISWTYPHDEILALERNNAVTEAAVPIASGLAVENLRFRYEITGDNPPWRPIRAFDDGRQVFIEFPARIDQGEAPPLFVLGPQGDAQLVNYRVRGNYYIVDRLFAAAELRLGEEPQQIVRIGRTDGLPADGSDRRRPGRSS